MDWRFLGLKGFQSVILCIFMLIFLHSSNGNGKVNSSTQALDIWQIIESEFGDVDGALNQVSESQDNSSQRHFSDTVNHVSQENTVRLLDYFRRRNREGQCNPETNIYPCGALDFLGCTGNKKFYAESVIRLNWFEAWEFCRNNEMHLASVESTYEQVFLELFLPKPESGAREGYWLSGTDFGREGLFYWMAGGKSFTYTNWRKSEPNNYKNREHCVQMNSNLVSTDALKWNDVACNSVGYVICQEPYSRKDEPLNNAYDFIQERDNGNKKVAARLKPKSATTEGSTTMSHSGNSGFLPQKSPILAVLAEANKGSYSYHDDKN